MTVDVDLHDIQGNVVRGYARFGFPRARYLLFSIGDAAQGQTFTRHLLAYVTSGGPWSKNPEATFDKRPSVTTNVAISYAGLEALDVPDVALRTFPNEFSMGMRARKDILGDDGPSAPEHWDPVWKDSSAVHLLVTLNGPAANPSGADPLEERYRDILRCAELSGEQVTLLEGHRGPDNQDNLPYQEGSALYENGRPTPKEHFGYVDGISNPYFEGSGTHPANVVGGGKLTKSFQYGTDLEWTALETGEFLLGYRDEASEAPIAPLPAQLGTNGTFMVFRKLHENVDSFRRFLDEEGAKFPEGKEALAAKFAGRWRNGAPITRFPTEQLANAVAFEWGKAKQDIEDAKTPEEREQAKLRFSAVQEQFVNFTYEEDLPGGRCPIGAHTRRVNPRGALEFGENGAFETPSALTNRRRIIRRGLPYGSSPEGTRDGDDHGIVFMAIGASIERQFEFVQQQWINYGNDFRLANEKDPMLGNHEQGASGCPVGRMTIQGGESDDSPPYFCGRIPRLVETRGGEYFFVPSLTALRLIATGTVDPT